jgi:hypothetical protein
MGISTDYLIVAGGAGGGSGNGSGVSYGGGGGGGGMQSATTILDSGTQYNITVGGAGAGGAQGANGSNSIISGTGLSLTSIGGGGGAGYPTGPGRSGGSGGGGAFSRAPGAGTPGQGNAGGAAGTGANGNVSSGGGGGGGAGGAGGNPGTASVPGGIGRQWSVNGSYYGGGGGARFAGTNPAGGGGTAGSLGVTNTGGGGGQGAGYSGGKAGGSGIVIVRYPTATANDGVGGVKTISGEYTLHTFTTSNTFIVYESNIPYNTVAPTISNPSVSVPDGVANVGQTLLCTQGTWTANGTTLSYTYQWKRNSVDISGESNNSYVIANTDVSGTFISCVVTATNDISSTQATSNTYVVAFNDQNNSTIIYDFTTPTQNLEIYSSANNTPLTESTFVTLGQSSNTIYDFTTPTQNLEIYSSANNTPLTESTFVTLGQSSNTIYDFNTTVTQNLIVYKTTSYTDNVPIVVGGTTVVAANKQYWN